MTRELDCQSLLTTADADVLRTRVRKLLSAIATTTWEVAEIVYRLWDATDHFSRWGYRSRAEWLEKDLGLAARKAEQLRRMYEYFAVDAPLPAELDTRLRRLDWTKARSLVGHMKAENASELVEKAETLTRDELWASLSRSTAKPAPNQRPASSNQTPTAPNQTPTAPDSRETFHCMRFSLADAANDEATQYKVVRDALKRASELSGSAKDGHNLTLICMDFLATNDFGRSNDPRMISRYLAKIESLLGVHVIALDAKTNEIAYGAHAWSLDTTTREHAKGAQKDVS